MLGLAMRQGLGQLAVKAQVLFLFMGSFSVHLCWVTSCHGRDVAGSGMLHLAGHKPMLVQIAFQHGPG